MSEYIFSTVVPIVFKGMGGVFAVIMIIWLSITLLSKVIK